jgi:hypothetical protein
MHNLFINIIFTLILLFPSIAKAETLDDLASNLAGLTGNSEHKQAMENLWQAYEEKNLTSLKLWQQQEIAPLEISKKCTLFYPFSGPDIVHMISLFPACEKYIMVGLEATGKISNLDIDKIDLAKLRQGLHSLLNRSFFVTREMWDDFSIESNGVLTPIITLLKRMNASLIALETFYLDSDGKIKTNVAIGNGIKIIFKLKDQDNHQELYYIKKSLIGNEHGIDKLIEGEPLVITYLKAAQYALFDPRFNLIRKTIIDKSQLLLQDDSGIPYHYFNNKDWEISYYGNYEGAYGKDFAGYNQPDLKKAYNKHESKALPFSLGYGYRKITTILLKMIKADSTLSKNIKDSIISKESLKTDPSQQLVPTIVNENADKKVIEETSKEKFSNSQSIDIPIINLDNNKNNFEATTSNEHTSSDKI